MSNGADNFYKSDKVTLKKVTFKNQYRMKVVGYLFMPKGMTQGDKLPAIIVGHPMGAVKAQSVPPKAAEIIRPGAPLRRIGKANEAADAIVFLASNRSAFTTGQRLALDGGFST